MPGRDAIIAAAWRKGNLAWMLRPVQRDVRTFLQNTEGMHATAFMHRGAGKSYLACVLAVERCASKPYQNVKYLGPTAKMVHEITMPHLRRILETCPPDIAPKYDAKYSCYRFPNGSSLHIAGTDGGTADSWRGTDTHLAVFDEEGFMLDPNYVVDSVIAPRAIPVSGKILHTSSAPLTPAHPFAARVKAAEAEGTLFKLRLEDNKYISAKEKEAYIRAMGGKDSIAYRRECNCEILMDETLAVLPELLKAPLVGEAADFGKYKSTAPVLICSFRPVGATVGILARVGSDGKLFIEKEFWLPFGSVEKLKTAIRELTEPLGRPCEVYANTTDEDASKGLDFLTPLPECDLARAVWALRTTIGSGMLSVHPDCKHVLRHLHGCIWKQPGKSFDSSGDGLDFDFVSVLSWLAYGFASMSENKTMIVGAHNGRSVLGVKNGRGPRGGGLWENPEAGIPGNIRSLLRHYR